MIDIADKIYAATGLTLNAEAAVKVGHMIRLARQEAADEIEKLRAENAKLAASNHAYLSHYQEAADEIEKLRVALKKISVTARRKDETPEALLVVCDAIARAPWGEGP
jgi:hypothetical protein